MNNSIILLLAVGCGVTSTDMELDASPENCTLPPFADDGRKIQTRIACNPPPPEIMSGDDACVEQMTAWCSHIGYPTSGCLIANEQSCLAHRTTVLVSAEHSCLVAINNTTPDVFGDYAFPTTCSSMWL